MMQEMTDYRPFRARRDALGGVAWHLVKDSEHHAACGLSKAQFEDWTGYGSLTVFCNPCRAAVGDMRKDVLEASLIDYTGVAHAARTTLRIASQGRSTAMLQTFTPVCSPQWGCGRADVPALRVSCLMCLAIGRLS